MTVSSSSTYQFNIGQIVTQAYIDAGLLSVRQQPSLAEMTDGALKVQRITSDIQAKGIFARTSGFQLVTLVAGTSVYALPANVMDVIGPGMFLAAGQPTTGASGETQVMAIAREEWHEMSAKDATGRPTMYYPVRTTDTLSVQLWPTPSATEATGHIRFSCHQLRADATDTTKTADFERYWTDWVISELSARLAMSNSLPTDRVQLLQMKANGKLRDCRALSNERVSQRFTIGHRSGWEGR